MQSKRMIDLAIFWLPILGGILLGGICFNAWYSGSKIVALWTGFAGLLCFELLAAAQWHQAISKAAHQPVVDDAVRTTQSAIIGIYKWEFKNIDAGKNPYARAEVANVGKTRAVIIDDYSQITVNSSLPDIPVYQSHPTNIELSPNQAIYMEFDGITTDPPIVLTPGHIAQLIEGKTRLFIWGRLTFRNMFDEVWDYGFIIQCAPIRNASGVSWRDISPGLPNYSFLRKRS
jgi:hypothetical protein